MKLARDNEGNWKIIESKWWLRNDGGGGGGGGGGALAPSSGGVDSGYTNFFSP